MSDHVKIGEVKTAKEKRKILTELIGSEQLTVAPGVFDMLSAKIADRENHQVLYMSGYATVASYLGLPDAGLASYTDMVGRAGSIASVTSVPLIADADTGFGGLLNVQHTVRGFEKAGVAAIQIEDQEFPKKCGHTLGRRIIDAEDMVDKISVAVDSRKDSNFLIIARTDARTSLGLDEAIDRALAYRRAGADVLFVESPESESEFGEIASRIDAPLLANMVEGGRSPVLSKSRLEGLGYSLAIYPGTGFFAAASALKDVYAHILETGSSLGSGRSLYPIEEMHELMGFEKVWEFEKKWEK